MSDTNFIPTQTTVAATWCQDVNDVIYRLLGASAGPGGVAPTTRQQIVTNLGITSNVLDSVATLRGQTGSTLKQAITANYYADVAGGANLYFYVPTDTTSGAWFTASISGTTLTVTNVANGTLAVGQAVNWSGNTGLTYITALGTGTGGVGTYTLSTSQTIGSQVMTADNGGSVIVGFDGSRYYGNLYAASAMQFGAKGDGTTLDSRPCQALLDAMKGRTAVFDAGRTFQFAGLTMADSTYNNSVVRFDGQGLLAPDGGQSTFGGAWVGLLLGTCDHVTVTPNFNGNRANMTAREQIFALGIAGSTDITIPRAMLQELRGDGIYISQASWTASSANPSAIHIGELIATNSADDGRNALSIISGIGVDVDYVYSAGVGGVINTVTEPGGVDIEPDHGYQTCANIRIGYLDVTTAGNAGFGIVGKSISGNDANRDWNCFNIRVDDGQVLKTGTSTAALSGPPLTRFADTHINLYYQYNATAGAGPVVDLAQRNQLKFKSNNVTYGAWIGPSDFLNDSTVEVETSSYSDSAVKVTGTARVTISGMARNASLASASVIHTHNNGRAVTQASTVYKVNGAYDGVVGLAFNNEPSNPVSFDVNTVARDCDWTGYASFAATSNATIRCINILGMNYATAMPGNGTWNQGTFVSNLTPNNTGAKTTIGWARLNTGSNNVAGTDWVACVCTNS